MVLNATFGPKKSVSAFPAVSISPPESRRTYIEVIFFAEMTLQSMLHVNYQKGTLLLLRRESFSYGLQFFLPNLKKIAPRPAIWSKDKNESFKTLTFACR